MEEVIGELHRGPQDANTIVTYSPSPSPVRDRRSRDDYRSPVHSRSISRSPPRSDRSYRRSPSRSPPHDDGDYRRSPSPRENGRSLPDGKDHAPTQSRSQRGKSRSPSRSCSRSYSPR
ncbi:hypothetical protein PanWU01x14_007060 [Parasponia andersonii]|uniref:Uncharacterized protein n=1 Tax=Parasponia andersonii TaxID=3476 RepID=A0A2P5E3Z3_PARAD|nr:hypothetical protein PanWU01x14_007060 [Parasponia andersonii]